MNEHDVFLNRHNLALAALASKESHRTALTGVYVAPDRTVATDGHCLGIVDTPKIGDDEFPNVGNVTAAGAPLTPCIIPADACNAIAKAIPRRSRLPILRNARVDVTASNANGTVRVVATDLSTTTPIEAQKVDGTFPDYAHVIPGGEPSFTIAFAAPLLARVLKIAGEMAVGRNGAVKLEFFTDTGPVKITCETEEGQRATFLVMPCRL